MKTLITVNGKHSINAEFATKLLNTLDNSLNRELIPSKVKKYQKDMINGKWSYNGDTIRITTDGHLVDGQHRLTAIVESDTVQDLYFIVDLETETDGVKIFEVIDQESRKPHEVLKIANPTIRNPKEMTALMQQLASFNLKQLHISPNGKKVSINSLVEFTEDFIPLSTLDNFIERGATLASRSKLLTVKEWIFLSATINQLEQGSKFLERLASLTYEDKIVFDNEGYEVDYTNPIANLVFNLNRTFENKLNQKMRYTQLFNAYNLFLNEEEVKPKSVGTSKLHYPKEYENYTAEEA